MDDGYYYTKRGRCRVGSGHDCRSCGERLRGSIPYAPIESGTRRDGRVVKGDRL
jgi:hypothetical protein